jgi:hypothetical protein
MVAITIITMMTDGTIHNQRADPGWIFQGAITQKKSGLKARETKEVGESRDTRDVSKCGIYFSAA